MAGVPDALRQAGTEAQLEVVHRDVVEHRVRARQVDVLEDAGAGLSPHTPAVRAEQSAGASGTALFH